MPDPADPHARPAGADEEPADEDDCWDEAHNELVYLKYEFEGLATVEELSAALRELATRFDDMSAAGWRLNAPVDTGYAHLVKDLD